MTQTLDEHPAQWLLYNQETTHLIISDANVAAQFNIIAHGIEGIRAEYNGTSMFMIPENTTFTAIWGSNRGVMKSFSIKPTELDCDLKFGLLPPNSGLNALAPLTSGNINNFFNCDAPEYNRLIEWRQIQHNEGGAKPWAVDISFALQGTQIGEDILNDPELRSSGYFVKLKTSTRPLLFGNGHEQQHDMSLLLPQFASPHEAWDRSNGTISHPYNITMSWQQTTTQTANRLKVLVRLFFGSPLFILLTPRSLNG